MSYADFFTATAAPEKKASDRVPADEQLIGNIKTQVALFNGETRKNRKNTLIEPTFERKGNSVHFFLKYANAPLTWPDGEKYHAVAEDKFEDAMAFLIQRVEAGDFDDAINAVRKARKWTQFVRKEAK